MGEYLLVRSAWAGVSVECATENVPDDGRFHVLVDGRIVQSIKSRAAAMRAYKEAILASGKGPPPRDEAERPSAYDMARAEDLDADFHRSVMYWNNSRAHARGGKLKHR